MKPQKKSVKILSNLFDEFSSNEHVFVLKIIELMQSDAVNGEELNSIIREYKSKASEVPAYSALEIVFRFIEVAVSDQLITKEEAIIIEAMKLLFKIKDGDFWRLRRHQVALVVDQQLTTILEDPLIDEDSDLFLVDLQALFDLSTDQFQELCRPIVAKHRHSELKIKHLHALGIL